MSDLSKSARDPIAIAERMQRRRTRIFTIEGILFLVWQGIFLTNREDPGASYRLVDWIRISGFMGWALVLLFLLATGGGFVWRRDVRELMRDESTRAHNRMAQAAGFWAAMIAALAVYVLSIFEPVTPSACMHWVLSAGIGVALLRFAMLERRGERG